MRLLALLAVLMLAVPALAQAQQTPAGRVDERQEQRREEDAQRVETDRHMARTDGLARPSTPAARQTLYTVAGCLARSSAGESADMLKMDFRTPQYRAKMDRLFANNQSCIRGARYIRSNRMLVAGDLAEHLLAAAPQRVNVRLAAIPSDRASAPRTPTDGVAMCVARSDPDNAARLFATAVASPEEVAASQALAPALGACNRTGTVLSASPAGVRAMLATAIFRLLEGQEP